MAEPQYRLVVDEIQGRINDGHYFRGGRNGKLPTIRDMCLEFEVGATTMKMALAILEDRGVIESRQGAGFFVTRRYGHRDGATTHTATASDDPGASESGAIPDTSEHPPCGEPDTPLAAL